MSDPIDSTNEEELEAKRKKKRGEGEGSGEAGSAVAGYVRASGEGIVSLTVDQKKRVWADFRHLDLNEVVSVVAEFFSEFPARASANCVVAWENVMGIPIVNMVIKFGQDVAMAVRERTRESAVQVRRRYGVNLKFRKRGMAAAPPAHNPQAG